MKQKTKNILRLILRVINHILQQLIKGKKQEQSTTSHPEPSEG